MFQEYEDLLQDLEARDSRAASFARRLPETNLPLAEIISIAQGLSEPTSSNHLRDAYLVTQACLYLKARDFSVTSITFTDSPHCVAYLLIRSRRSMSNDIKCAFVPRFYKNEDAPFLPSDFVKLVNYDNPITIL